MPPKAPGRRSGVPRIFRFGALARLPVGLEGIAHLELLGHVEALELGREQGHEPELVLSVDGLRHGQGLERPRHGLLPRRWSHRVGGRERSARRGGGRGRARDDAKARATRTRGAGGGGWRGEPRARAGRAVPSGRRGLWRARGFKSSTVGFLQAPRVAGLGFRVPEEECRHQRRVVVRDAPG